MKVGRFGEAVWVQFGMWETRARVEQLEWCLVGQWGEVSGSLPELALMRSWGAFQWNLKGVECC